MRQWGKYFIINCISLCTSFFDCFFLHVETGLFQNLIEEKTSADCPLNPGNFKYVKLLPDGGADFTRAMGMSCTWDSSTRGFGERSWRYSVVINDMKIEKIFIEDGDIQQNSGTDPFEVSDVDTMLKYLKSVQK